MSKKVEYDSVGAIRKDKSSPLTVEEAKAYLGWQTEEDAGVEFKAGTYHLRDLEGNKVRLTNNMHNRPLRLEIAKRYALEILRGKWGLNGETIVIDKHGQIPNGQHRMVGLVLAEQLRKKNPAKWKGYGWRGPVTIETIIVTGIDPKYGDTYDTGQGRKLNDVLYRRTMFPGTSTEQKKLSNVLSAATRLVWLRSGGMTVSDAPHFPHSEALEFIQQHPALKDAVAWIMECEGGGGVEGRRVSSYLSLGYAAALMYLMGMSASDPVKYQSEGALDESNWERAEEFWTLFAGDSEDLNPLRRALTNISASGGMGRDEICGTVIKAFNLWANGEQVTGKDIKVKRTTEKDTGKIRLAETPRLGGLDTEVERFEDEPADVESGKDAEQAPAEAENGKPKARRRSTKGKGKGKRSRKSKASEPTEEGDGEEASGDTTPEHWESGQPVIVRDDEGEWEGTLVEVLEDGTARVQATDGDVYETQVSFLHAAEGAAA